MEVAVHQDISSLSCLIGKVQKRIYPILWSISCILELLGLIKGNQKHQQKPCKSISWTKGLSFILKDIGKNPLPNKKIKRKVTLVIVSGSSNNSLDKNKNLFVNLI